MKSSMRRLVGGNGVAKKQDRSRGAATADMEELLRKPAELSWPDFLNLLLEIGAEIEHSLMVEYLYAAYSLGGAQVPEKHRDQVEAWRTTLLTIAREEMGHLLTVQNLRCLLGAPITFERENYPFDTPFYPFPFKLEPLSLESLSCYVYAEMPSRGELNAGRDRRLAARYREFLKEDKARIEAAVRKVAHGKPHRVGRIYEDILRIVEDENIIPDSCFDRATLTRQASFADWGRNYQPAPRDVDLEGSLIKAASEHRRARVIVTPMATRTEAIAALKDVAGQGEAPHIDKKKDELSHFDRFLEIYQEFKHVRGWSPVRNVPDNPTAGVVSDQQTPIEAEPARTWANLFNVRYRMLLAYLSHSYRLPPRGRVDEPNLRGTVIHRAFGEMYNLKAIAGLLVNLPLGPRSRQCAAPPFEMPYNTSLPETEVDCWDLHRELLATSAALRQSLLADATDDARRYLATLGDIDAQATGWVDQVLAGLGVRKRHSA